MCVFSARQIGPPPAYLNYVVFSRHCVVFFTCILISIPFRLFSLVGNTRKRESEREKENRLMPASTYEIPTIGLRAVGAMQIPEEGLA